ncbi:hypothetical protein ABIB15_001587 [Marisediminicola sp. UYEF4]|uniref:hypothetical protein n=1 Tax=Marisediminicola sp. UYEF4 TaxID=1756384 RepID=UPI0033981255
MILNSRTPWLSLIALVVLVLSACSAADGAEEGSSVTGGAIELAVSETCTDVSDPQCVSVNGVNVVLPSVFERANVEDAVVAAVEGQNAVDVTFSSDGEVVFNTLSDKAAQAGDAARLVMKIGGKIQAAVTVMQALDGNQMQIILSPEESAQEVVDLIRAG